MNAMLEKLFGVTKNQDMTNVIEEFQGLRIAWKPVGDNDNNLAIINLGRDPAAGVIERTTNAIDAILERIWIEKGRPAHLRAPRQAVEEWFGIAAGRLASLDTADLKNYKELASQVLITLRDGDRADKPTVDIRDHGVGLKSEEFRNSILSLNKNRKLRKLFLAGAFGQGGSTALAYSDYTVIFSRALDSNARLLNPVTATIVRFNPGDPQVDKHGVYEYMVDGATGFPFTFEATEAEFPAGTLVRHISMDITKYRQPITTPTNSLWYLVHNHLFDPVIPFTIEDARSSTKSATRTVTGNNRLLSQAETTEYQRSADRSFEAGKVAITWWVLSAEGESSKTRITQYTQASKPIIITYNGQKQGDFPNTIIKDELKMPYLDRYLVVHVDCDKLDNETRRRLFPTTRETVRETSLGDDLRRLITETLQADDELLRLDRERKQRYISNVDSSSVEKIRKRLASRISIITRAGGGRGPEMYPNKVGGPHNPKPPIPTQDPPTFITVTNSDPRKVYSGRSFTLNFETDARPDYFANPNSFIAAIDPPSFGRYTGTTRLYNGYGSAHFKVDGAASLDDSARITLEVRPPRSATISASITSIVIEQPEEAGTESGTKATPNINPIFIGKTDQYWIDNNWDETSVAEVVSETDEVNVYVSVENGKLNKLVARAQRHAVSAVEIVKDFYLEHISYHALIADLDRLHKQRNASGETPSLNTIDELKHASDTICGIIESLFHVLITEASLSAVTEGERHTTKETVI